MISLNNTTKEIQMNESRFAKHIKPVPGKMAVIDVGARIVKRMTHDITVGKMKAIANAKK
ncbi:hypothetical protein CEV33_2961 [Brucella grignonensis]|uniref:Uncharacterized protein n=1 Tax=Brucella grignonensis TaxID=94627 RepID=A0A256F321_9HYPH|nr:hypothetical protein CEV33_2961 [Brucella grignonensis]